MGYACSGEKISKVGQNFILRREYAFGPGEGGLQSVPVPITTKLAAMADPVAPELLPNVRE